MCGTMLLLRLSWKRGLCLMRDAYLPNGDGLGEGTVHYHPKFSVHIRPEYILEDVHTEAALEAYEGLKPEM